MHVQSTLNIHWDERAGEAMGVRRLLIQGWARALCTDQPLLTRTCPISSEWLNREAAAGELFCFLLQAFFSGCEVISSAEASAGETSACCNMRRERERKKEREKERGPDTLLNNTAHSHKQANIRIHRTLNFPRIIILFMKLLTQAWICPGFDFFPHMFLL